MKNLQVNENYFRRLKVLKKDFKYSLCKIGVGTLLAGTLLGFGANMSNGDTNFEFSDYNSCIENVTVLDNGYKVDVSFINKSTISDDINISRSYYLSKDELNDKVHWPEGNVYNLDENASIWVTPVNTNKAKKDMMIILGSFGVGGCVSLGGLTFGNYLVKKRNLKGGYAKKR